MKNPILLMLMLPVMVVAQTRYFKPVAFSINESDKTRSYCKGDSPNQPSILLVEAQPQYINVDSSFLQQPGRFNPFHADTFSTLHKAKDFKETSIYIFELIPNPDCIYPQQLFTLSSVPKRYKTMPVAFPLIFNCSINS